ncbi:hypothetical protein SR71_08515 [Klebsiella aerogenes]|uniref:DUF551 domain-containing protein n=1 Tax=Klebsiella aerogenes TaxID=548 RepID=UPI0005EF333E|nr:DUF551 domain-containing protein [Klebsiella aerogenes]KJP58478.1 hypothetical protein SR71_08515 [Klebsiella aerogenes]
MTKSTITRERLEQLANFKGAPVTRQEEQELARMALVAMDSEPVMPEEIPGSVYEVIYQECGGFVDCDANAQTIWNACRAAMLQAEPVTTANKLGNSPVIPDTWIPVSERMPEEGGRYWCYVEEQNSLGKSHYQWNCSWNGEIWGGAMMHGRVTHWMPLPAAPQEVK